MGDFADFSGPQTQGIWVTVSVTELGAYGELHLSMAINGSDFWVSPESPDMHWAMCGEKSTGQVPTGEAGAAAASAAPAVDLAVMRAVDEAALVRVLKGPHASFRAALAVGDLVDAKHLGGNGQWYQVRRAAAVPHCVGGRMDNSCSPCHRLLLLRSARLAKIRSHCFSRPVEYWERLKWLLLPRWHAWSRWVGYSRTTLSCLGLSAATRGSLLYRSPCWGSAMQQT